MSESWFDRELNWSAQEIERLKREASDLRQDNAAQRIEIESLRRRLQDAAAIRDLAS